MTPYKNLGNRMRVSIRSFSSSVAARAVLVVVRLPGLFLVRGDQIVDLVHLLGKRIGTVGLRLSRTLRGLLLLLLGL